MDQAKFREAIDASGFTKKFIAEKTGLSYRRFSSLYEGTVRCNVDDARRISEFLKWDRKQKAQIFLF